MKVKLILAFFICAVFSAYSQTIEDDIRTMMDVTNSLETAKQVMSYMIEQYKNILPEVPSDYWDAVMEEMDMRGFIEFLVPIYKKYYTQKDIQGIIEFYQSPVGQKMIEVQPALTQESMTAGQEWGTIIGEQIMKKLQDDGYIEI